MEVLRLSEEAGLVPHVHQQSGSPRSDLQLLPVQLHGVERMDPDSRTPTRSQEPVHASVDTELCAGCGTCRDERCPVSAIELIDETAQV